MRADLLEPLGMRHTSPRPQDPSAHGLGVHPDFGMIGGVPASKRSGAGFQVAVNL